MWKQLKVRWADAVQHKRRGVTVKNATLFQAAVMCMCNCVVNTAQALKNTVVLLIHVKNNA